MFLRQKGQGLQSRWGEGWRPAGRQRPTGLWTSESHSIGMVSLAPDEVPISGHGTRPLPCLQPCAILIHIPSPACPHCPVSVSPPLYLPSTLCSTVSLYLFPSSQPSFPSGESFLLSPQLHGAHAFHGEACPSSRPHPRQQDGSYTPPCSSWLSRSGLFTTRAFQKHMLRVCFIFLQCLLQHLGKQ